MAKMLYPELHDGGSNDNHRSNRSSVSHPLHREDPLYDAADVEEQVRLLAKHTRQRQTQRGSVTPTPRVRNPLSSPQQVRSVTQPTAGSNSAGKRASTGTSNGTSKDTSRGVTSGAEQAPSSCSRRLSTGSFSSHASLHTAPPSTFTARSNVGVFNDASSSRRSSEIYELAGVQQNGSSSSRHSITHPSNVYPANGKGLIGLLLLFLLCTYFNDFYLGTFGSRRHAADSEYASSCPCPHASKLAGHGLF